MEDPNDERIGDMSDLAQFVSAARYNRGAAEETEHPDVEEIAELMALVAGLNEHGTTDEFVDAQAALIDALVVRLDDLGGLTP